MPNTKGEFNHYCVNCQKTTRHYMDGWIITCLTCGRDCLTLATIDDLKVDGD